MTDSRETSVPLERAQAELADLIRAAAESGEAQIIVRDGDECAALLSSDQYRKLLHTIELLRGVGEGLTDIAAGRTTPWDDVRDNLLARVEASKRA